MAQNEEKLIKKYLLKKHKYLESQQKKCVGCSFRKSKVFSKMGETRLLKPFIPERCKCKQIYENKCIDYNINADKNSKAIDSTNESNSSLIEKHLELKNDYERLQSGDHKINGKETQILKNTNSSPKVSRNSKYLFKDTSKSRNSKAEFFDSLSKEKTNYLYNNNLTHRSIYNLLSNKPMKTKPARTTCFLNSIHPTKSRLNKNQKSRIFSHEKSRLSEKIQFVLNNSNGQGEVIVQTEQPNIADFIKKYVTVEYSPSFRSECHNKALIKCTSDFQLDLKENSDTSYVTDISSEKEFCIESCNESLSSDSILGTPFTNEHFAQVSEVYFKEHEEVEMINSKTDIINTDTFCNYPYFKTEIVTSKINYETIHNISMFSDFHRMKSETKSRESLFIKTKDLRSPRIVCYLCGNLFSSLSIQSHYYSCRNKWKNLVRMFSGELLSTELPTSMIEQSEDRMTDDFSFSKEKIDSSKDTDNIIYESSKLIK